MNYYLFSKISMAGVGGIVSLIGLIFGFLGIPYVEQDASEAITGLLTFLGWVWLMWGTFRREDLTGGLVRKVVK